MSLSKSNSKKSYNFISLEGKPISISFKNGTDSILRKIAFSQMNKNFDNAHNAWKTKIPFDDLREILKPYHEKDFVMYSLEYDCTLEEYFQWFEKEKKYLASKIDFYCIITIYLQCYLVPVYSL